MGIKGWMLGLAAAGAAGEYGIARYFFHRTVVRGNAKRDRTQKMAGTDWDAHIPGIRASREWLAGQPQEDVYITSRDGLRLHGTFFCCEGSRRAVVCFHGYTSEGLNDYTSIAKFYLNQGFNLMVVDERAHGKSEGTYIGFGCLDRYDALQWMAGRGLRADASRYFHGSRHRADVYGPGASRAGKGRCVRLCLYLCLGSVQPCAEEYVPYAGFSRAADCGPHGQE